MVTTTADLSVKQTTEGVTVFYASDNIETAYIGYWSDYHSRALTEVRAPMSVTATAYAYSLLYSGESFEVFLQPVERVFYSIDAVSWDERENDLLDFVSEHTA